MIHLPISSGQQTEVPIGASEAVRKEIAENPKCGFDRGSGPGDRCVSIVLQTHGKEFREAVNQARDDNRMAITCLDCDHVPVCAIRKAFDGPNKKLAKAREGGDGDKEQIACNIEEQGEALSKLVASYCPNCTG